MNYHHPNQGFTLIEVLIVLGMVAIFATMGLVFSFDSYRGYLFRSEYTTTVNLLAKARNRAINNFNESNHAVSILDGEYRLYKIDGYDPGDSATYESFPRNNALTFEGPEEIIFEQLSGNLAECEDEDGNPIDPCTYTFGYGLKTKSITINDMGGITW
jgi:prepilin-type N-terminal cleavage/methylation domain-containing protein